jgi:hypothetical protein
MSAISKEIMIDGKAVKFRASAAIPRIYRLKFGRDVFADMQTLSKGLKENNGFSIKSLETFENVAYIMAKHADPANVPDDMNDWFDQFGTFSIYEVLPELIDLWGINTKTDIDAKKGVGH